MGFNSIKTMAKIRAEDDFYLLCEEEEKGVVEGCDPSPWYPCVYPPRNMKRTYTLTRKWYSLKSQLKQKCDCHDRSRSS